MGTTNDPVLNRTEVQVNNYYTFYRETITQHHDTPSDSVGKTISFILFTVVFVIMIYACAYVIPHLFKGILRIHSHKRSLDSSSEACCYIRS